nr:hypothetical protein [Tanacetum cinerariifolium]
MNEDILFLESLLRDNPIPPHPINLNQTKLPIEETNHSLNIGYEHFNTNLLTKDIAESSTKNLIPIPNECMTVSENRSQSTEPINDNCSDSTIISNPLFDNDKINFDEINSHVEFNSDESTSNHDTEKSDYLDEFYGPFIPIHILEEKRTRREHADYINRLKMLFTINPRPHNSTNYITNVESSSSLPIPNQESGPHQEEIDVISVTNDVLPPSDDDSDEEVDDVGDLRVDNVIQNSEHEYSESEDSDFDNPPLPLPPPEPPDKEFDFKIDFQNEISVVRNAIVKINARVKFDVFNDENDVFMFVIFAKEFSLLSAESEDTIFNPDSVTSKVLAPGMYAINVKPIPLYLKNNREVHIDYLKHLKESVATLREIVEEAKVERPLDRSVASACLYTKHSQKLLEYVIGTCLKDFNKRDKKQATTPLNRKKQVTFANQFETSNTNTQKHVEQQITQKTNVSLLLSTGINSCTDASGSKPRSNTKKNRISPAKSVNKKTV